MHCDRRAASRAACTAGSSRAIRTAMMAMTTKSSMSVNPRLARMDCSPAWPGTEQQRMYGRRVDRWPGQFVPTRIDESAEEDESDRNLHESGQAILDGRR